MSARSAFTRPGSFSRSGPPICQQLVKGALGDFGKRRVTVILDFFAIVVRIRLLGAIPRAKDQLSTAHAVAAAEKQYRFCNRWEHEPSQSATGQLATEMRSRSACISRKRSQ